MIINGNDMDFKEGITIEELLNNLKINKDKVVVEVDLNIIDKDEYNSFKLSTDSKVEIIRFVGGG
ncbi:sulfur carrier protein ThiS [Clostridium sporogenes]|uniref:Sulfur carrier protein n=1 Tax=Clostridium cochlearium TaxID=1494 RepID=A0A1G9K0G9_CLOCO|nr:sulfur carrier protein ThiS [Clostridium cochlearium]MBV1818866.1 sulfur carrier protein ThiS [Bacteroidales bacterium MSK.15.36]NSJ91545.1 sulfur carrier protein ThiS [Coprococcus sp. MSK.21.13]MBU5269596.1 sulfur carrier protein ThiS [Clostridium cochlearium]MCG4571585.1 sulfur carrier protein ThiS [Clostridium cochlearium]MCG4580818.1 sulfur carrier protein ThiS [Clostridium cochlearium]